MKKASAKTKKSYPPIPPIILDFLNSPRIKDTALGERVSAIEKLVKTRKAGK